jgi:hypothetical protein
MKYSVRYVVNSSVYDDIPSGKNCQGSLAFGVFTVIAVSGMNCATLNYT